MPVHNQMRIAFNRAKIQRRERKIHGLFWCNACASFVIACGVLYFSQNLNLPDMKQMILICCIICTVISCRKDSAIPGLPDQSYSPQYDMPAPILTTGATPFNSLFTRYGNGWTGGDGTYSVPLPGGRVLWMFGDSFLDTVYADRSRPASGLVRNVFCIQHGANLLTLVSGTLDDPQPFVNTPDPDNNWYWPGDGTVSGDTVFVYMMNFVRTGTGAWDFAYVKTDLIAFALPSVTELSRITVSADPDILYGACVMEDGGYLYIYGSESSGLNKYCHVARVPLTSVYSPWEYYNNTMDTWSASPPPVADGRLARSHSSLVDVSSQFSVFYKDGMYHLVTQEGFLGPTIYSYSGNSPTGPWRQRQILYITPETSGSIFTYNAFVHPEYQNAAGYTLLSYNLNTSDFGELFSDADSYRPKFIWFKY